MTSVKNTDHFCAKCNGYLAHKPYKGLTQAVPEDSILGLSLGSHHEGAESPADLNHVSEFYNDPMLTLQHEADQKAAPGSYSPQSQEAGIWTRLNGLGYLPGFTN
jgi:hypothetical protein